MEVCHAVLMSLDIMTKNFNVCNVMLKIKHLTNHFIKK